MALVPYQTIPSFVVVYLTSNVTPAGPGTILFNIIETDGSTPGLYNPVNGRFIAPVSGWYDLEVCLQTSAPLTNLRIIKNDDTNFPIFGQVCSSTNVFIKVRVNLGVGEYLNIQSAGGN